MTRPATPEAEDEAHENQMVAISQQDINETSKDTVREGSSLSRISIMKFHLLSQNEKLLAEMVVIQGLGVVVQISTEIMHRQIPAYVILGMSLIIG